MTIREDAERGIEHARAAEARFASILAKLNIPSADLDGDGDVDDADMAIAMEQYTGPGVAPTDPPVIEPPPVTPELPGSGDGFFVPVVHPGARVVYVSSSSGDDNNDGLSEDRPVKTLDRGVSLLRLGQPDHLLLRAGDVWRDESFDGAQLGGAGDDKPMVLGVYGQGPRPIIIPPHGSFGLKTKNQQIAGLVIQGLHFYAATRDPGSPKYVGRPGDIDGINIRIPTKEDNYIVGLVIEDCIVTHFDNNIILVDDWPRTLGVSGVPGRLQATIRRNIIRYASTEDSHAIGIYLEGTRDTVVEQNLLDHNGWAQTDGVGQRNKRSHNIYAQTKNGPIVIRDNIIARAAANGLQLRAGGDVLGNLFVRNAIAFYCSINDSRAIGNVILESDDINADEPRGFGINGWQMKRYEIRDNLIARRVGTGSQAGIAASAEAIVVTGNTIHAWSNNAGASIDVNKPDQVADNVTAGPFIDPDRGVGDYAEAIGVGDTLADFLDAASARRRGVWVEKLSADAVNTYIRAGLKSE